MCGIVMNYDNLVIVVNYCLFYYYLSEIMFSCFHGYFFTSHIYFQHSSAKHKLNIKMHLLDISISVLAIYDTTIERTNIFNEFIPGFSPIGFKWISLVTPTYNFSSYCLPKAFSI